MLLSVLTKWNEFHPVSIGGFLIVIAGIWTAIEKMRTERGCSRILKVAQPAKCHAGHTLVYWVELLNRDSSMTINATQGYTITWQGNVYLLIKASIHYLNLGRFGPLPGQSSVVCLLSTNQEATDVLAMEYRLFKPLILRGQIAAYSIRDVSSFARMLSNNM